MTEDILHELGPTALDLVVKLSHANEGLKHFNDNDEMIAAYERNRRVIDSICALATEIEARRLAELV